MYRECSIVGTWCVRLHGQSARGVEQPLCDMLNLDGSTPRELSLTKKGFSNYPLLHKFEEHMYCDFHVIHGIIMGNTLCFEGRTV